MLSIYIDNQTSEDIHIDDDLIYSGCYSVIFVNKKKMYFIYCGNTCEFKFNISSGNLNVNTISLCQNYHHIAKAKKPKDPFRKIICDYVLKISTYYCPEEPSSNIPIEYPGRYDDVPTSVLLYPPSVIGLITEWSSDSEYSSDDMPPLETYY